MPWFLGSVLGLAALGIALWTGPRWLVHRLSGRSPRCCALGSIYPYDAHLPLVPLAAAHILANVRPGAVIVLHEGGARGRRTVEVLRHVLPVLHARGYRVATLSELEATAPRG